MTKNVIRYFLLLLLSLLFFPFTVDFIYHEIELPYFRGLLYCTSFCFFALFLLTFHERYKKLKTIAINVSAVFILLCFCEFLFWFLNQHSLPKRKLHNTETLTIPDPILGYRIKENLHLLSTLTINQDTIYSCWVHSDAYGRRTTPFDSLKRKQAIFLGCSFTFGEGLNDEQTLPYLIGKNSAYNSYNLSCLGYGPQQALLLAKGVRPPAEETKVIYVYIDGHIQRANGTFSVVKSYGKNFPYPQLEDDSLLLCPSFQQKSPILFSFYSGLRDCQTLQYFNLDLPLFLREKHFELCGKTIEKLAIEVKEKYKTNLIFVVYPGSVEHEEVLKHIDINLIQVLDYSSLAEKGDETYFFKTDGHPNALMNKILADRILKDIFR